MKNNECNIVNDLLPLYIDKVVSKPTADFIENHVNTCQNCKEKLEILKKDIEMPSLVNERKDEFTQIKNLKKKLNHKKIKLVLLSFASLLALIILIACYMVFVRGVPTSYYSVDIFTDYETYNYSYGITETAEITDFCVDVFYRGNEKLFYTEEKTYEKDENGDKIITGITVTFRNSPIAISKNQDQLQNSYSYTYSVTDKDEIEFYEENDFTITLVFNNKTIVYSMKDESVIK